MDSERTSPRTIGRLATTTRILFFLASLFVLGLGVALAARSGVQEPPPDPPPAELQEDFGRDRRAPSRGDDEEPPEGDELGRSTPRGTIAGFLAATRAGDHRRAASYLDFGEVGEPGPGERARYAQQLRVVLDRHLQLDPADFSALESGDVEDGDLRRDLVGEIQTPEGPRALWLQRGELAEAGPRKDELVWRFSPGTVALVPELYEARGYGWIEEVLPTYFFEMRLLALELWQWLGLLALVVAASFAGLFLALIVIRAARWLIRGAEREWPGRIVDAAAGPLRLVLSVWLFYLGAIALLYLTLPARSFIGTTAEVLVLLAATWLLIRLVDVGAFVVREHFRERGVHAAQTLVPMGVRITKVFVVFVALLSMIHNLGFNVASILAGLGIGGLAVALALQKPLENLFSGIAVIMDQPVKVGDFCRVGDHIGTVEDIGLRSTRIRTLDRTLLAIPNADFASARVDSFTARDKIRLYHVLSFGYDTSPDQMRFLLTRIREVLHSHPKTDPDPCRARFMRYGAFSLDVEIFVFIKTTDFNEFLAIQEDLFLRIYDVVAESGAYFAYPSQTLYLGRDQGRDAERTKLAEESVRAWREAGELPFPDLPPQRVAEIDDSLAWPPEGAPRPVAPSGDGAGSPPGPGKGSKGRKGWWR